jgi:hypothetical protein
MTATALALGWSAVGTFVTASAFRTTDVEAVRSGVAGSFDANSWPSESVDLETPVSTDDVAFYAPSGGWAVVLWPAYFTELAAAEYISSALAAAASTMSIHDGDYWRHVLLRDGVVLDRFASLPSYFTDDPGETERFMPSSGAMPR